MQLNWSQVDAAVAAWEDGGSTFRLREFNFAEYMTDEWNGQDGTLSRAVWRFWLAGVADIHTPPSHPTVRAGWHYARRSGDNVAVLTAVEPQAERFLPSMDPLISVEEWPSVAYAVAMDLDFCAHVLLDRQYPEPHTQRDAVLTILRAWEKESQRRLYWTIRTIAGYPCVLV